MRLFQLSLFGLIILGCNKPVDNLTEVKDKPGSQNVKSQYPHGKDFFKSHGISYYTDSKTCLTCHTPGGATDSPQTRCSQCHDQYPHPSDWGSAAQHATEYKKNPEKCIQCHGADLLGKNSRVSCNQCHKAYPHSEGWVFPTGHGKAFLELTDRSGCFSCHDPGNQSNDSVGFCDRCHTAFPHPARFAFSHGAKARSYDGHCTSCHRDFKENMPKYGTKGGCYFCHRDKTLKIHWVDPQNAQVHPNSKNRKPGSSR